MQLYVLNSILHVISILRFHNIFPSIITRLILFHVYNEIIYQKGEEKEREKRRRGKHQWDSGRDGTEERARAGEERESEFHICLLTRVFKLLIQNVY